MNILTKLYFKKTTLENLAYVYRIS